MTTATAVPTVTPVGRTKIRIQAPESEYTLDLLDAQELASSLALALESIEDGYDMPHKPTRKRTVRVSQRRSITVTGGRRAPNVKMKHAPVIQIGTEQAHELIAVLVSEIEATEDRFESKGVDPYP